MSTQELFDLTGKVALVTGGNSGLGLGFATGMAPDAILKTIEGGIGGFLGMLAPILVLGASGFIGANLLKTLLAHRTDVVGTASNLPAWRLEGIPEANVRALDLLADTNLDNLLDSVKPRRTGRSTPRTRYTTSMSETSRSSCVATALTARRSPGCRRPPG